MKHKYKHKSKKVTKTLSDWKEVRARAPYNKKIRKLIKAFREQVITLAGINPF